MQLQIFPSVGLGRLRGHLFFFGSRFLFFHENWKKKEDASHLSERGSSCEHHNNQPFSLQAHAIIELSETLFHAHLYLETSFRFGELILHPNNTIPIC